MSKQLQLQRQCRQAGTGRHRQAGRQAEAGRQGKARQAGGQEKGIKISFSLPNSLPKFATEIATEGACGRDQLIR